MVLYNPFDMIKSIKTCILLLSICSMVSCSTVRMKHNYVKTELYFGLSDSGKEITEGEWNLFKNNYIDKVFSGYTEINSKGFWTNKNSITTSEKSKVIIYLNKGTSKDSLDITRIINAYKEKFNQESVLKIETKVNALF